MGACINMYSYHNMPIITISSLFDSIPLSDSPDLAAAVRGRVYLLNCLSLINEGLKDEKVAHSVQGTIESIDSSIKVNLNKLSHDEVARILTR